MHLNPEILKPRAEEVLRYMGWKRKEVATDEYAVFLERAEKELAELKLLINPKYIYSSLDKRANPELFQELFGERNPEINPEINPGVNPGINPGVNSEEDTERDSEMNLKRNSNDGIRKFICDFEKVYLGAVTLGFEYENILKAAGSGDSSRLLLLESCGTELIESAMNLVEEEIRELESSPVSSRFSPGYGGWDLSHQRKILDYLQASRLGIYLNDYNLMIPRKSVTAVIKMAGFNQGCGSCDKLDCDFRKI